MTKEEKIQAIYEKIPGFDGYLINRRGEVKKENTYRTRINNGWDKITAIITKSKKYNNIITFNGLSKTLSEWSEYIGIDYKTLYRRYYIKKYPLYKVFTKEKFDGKTIL